VVLPVLLATAAAWATPIQADLHLDTPTQLHRKKVDIDGPGLEAGLVQLQAAGTNLAVEVLWPPRNADHVAHTLALLDRLESAIAAQDALQIVRNPTEAQAAADAGRIGVLVALEGTHGLQAEDWRKSLQGLQDRGLGMVGLTWSFSTPFAGSSGDNGAGLTEKGRALLAHCQSKGLIVDLSHASRDTTLEVCSKSKVPVIASHSNAHKLAPHARNLSDDEIRCIAATGGVIGLNLHGPFVGGARDLGAVVAQANHLAHIGGHGVVALGSDYDGLIQPVAGLPNASHLPDLWRALQTAGWTEEQVRGVQGENFLRAWRGVTAGVR
jgi:membrane dipeptidase